MYSNCRQCVVLKTEPTHRVVDPARPTAVVVFVLALEDQVALSVKLLGGPVELAIHICPIEDAAFFICVHPLALQSVIYIETLQRTVKEDSCGLNSIDLATCCSEALLCSIYQSLTPACSQSVGDTPPSLAVQCPAF